MRPMSLLAWFRQSARTAVGPSDARPRSMRVTGRADQRNTSTGNGLVLSSVEVVLPSNAMAGREGPGESCGCGSASHRFEDRHLR